MKKMFIAISLLFSLTITSANAVEVTIEEKITGLYVAFFNRAADQAGLEYWTTTADNVAKQGGDVSSVFKTLSGGFATHPTFKLTYDHLENKAFVEAIYRNALGRDGDTEGITYWTDLLDRVMSRSDMVATFVELSMVKDLTKENFPNLTDEELAAAQLRQDLITNKVRVAVTFTNQLDTLSNVVDSDAPESDPAYLASIMIISEVTEDEETVFDVIAFLDSIINSNDPISSINDSLQPEPETAALTYDNGYLLNTTGDIVTITDIKYHMVADLVMSGYNYQYDYTFSYVDGSSGTYTFNGTTYDIPTFSYGTELSIPIYQNTPLSYSLPNYTFSGMGITGTVYYTYTFVTTGGDFTYTSTITYK